MIPMGIGKVKFNYFLDINSEKNLLLRIVNLNYYYIN